jgi:hydroxymethylglutaryl-CoA synthase
MKAGIVGFGAYVPEFRIKTETIAEVWNQNPETIKNNLLIFEKSVPGKDEDAATIAVSAAQNALARAKINPKKLGAIYVGSESHPYAVKPTASIVGEAIGAGNNYTAADLEFACKAGSAGLQACAGLVKSEMIEYGLAIGADTAQAGEGNALEYSAAAGGAAFIVGSKSQEVLAVIDHTLSFSSDTPDFWRRGLQANPEHAGRFTGQPAYFKHVLSATENILKETSLKPTDFDYAVFHMPNGKFPLAASKKLGFSKGQVEPGLVVTKIGNTYSGSSLLGLSAVLDIAKPGQKLLVTSYGSGSGSDAFVLTVTDNIEEKRNLALKTNDYFEKKKYISYAKYRRHMELLHK